jgi:hypothetical protein
MKNTSHFLPSKKRLKKTPIQHGAQDSTSADPTAERGFPVQGSCTTKLTTPV